jgi:uncharacterized membrane protein YoaK (UPF0700 family)
MIVRRTVTLEIDTVLIASTVRVMTEESPTSGSGASPRPASPLGFLVADAEHGPLPALLLVLTIVTGVVDAVSVLTLGRVFVANMTGNVVFLGFAIAGAPGFSLGASLVALAAFITGAATAGIGLRRMGPDRAALFRTAALVEAMLVGVAVIVAVASGEPFAGGTQAVLAGVTATAMGIQNAVVRHLGVPDLPTTVLTMALTGLVSDLPTPQRRPAIIRRVLAITTIVVGAVAGAELVLHVNAAAALTLAFALLVSATVAATIAARTPGDWRHH